MICKFSHSLSTGVVSAVWIGLPSFNRVLILPLCQRSRLSIEHSAWSFTLDLRCGFCRSRVGKVKAAFSAMLSRAIFSPYCKNSQESSLTKAFPSWPDGTLKMLCTSVPTSVPLLNRPSRFPEQSLSHMICTTWKMALGEVDKMVRAEWLHWLWGGWCTGWLAQSAAEVVDKHSCEDVQRGSLSIEFCWVRDDDGDWWMKMIWKRMYQVMGSVWVTTSS